MIGPDGKIELVGFVFPMVKSGRSFVCEVDGEDDRLEAEGISLLDLI
jgi:hypothetical protein